MAVTGGRKSRIRRNDKPLLERSQVQCRTNQPIHTTKVVSLGTRAENAPSPSLISVAEALVDDPEELVAVPEAPDVFLDAAGEEPGAELRGARRHAA